MPGFKPGIFVIELLLQEGASVIESKTHGHLCLLGPAQTCRYGLLSHKAIQRPPLAADAALSEGF